MIHPPLSNLDQIRSALFGLSVGDALGVPVETKSRLVLKRNPVKDMRGFGKYKQPAGTWSDDSSLAFCLAEGLSEGFDMVTIAKYFVQWVSKGYWSANGNVFDVGKSTGVAINRLKRGFKPELGGATNYHNGNGSIMRILPLLFHIKDKPIEERYELTRMVSSITHAQPACVIGCFYYLEFARLLLNQVDKFAAYETLKKEFIGSLDRLVADLDEAKLFDELLTGDITTVKEREIVSGDVVEETLVASIWCLLNTDNYTDAVLKAVNLGDDTDTTAAVTGGLAGLIYGYDQIPLEWIDVLARKDDIDDLCRRLSMR